MNKVDGLRESITLNKVAELDGEAIVRMSAEIFSDPTRETTYSVAVSNMELYTANLAKFRTEINEFKDVVKQREDFIIGLYYPEPEEAPEEEAPVDPEEPIEDTEPLPEVDPEV